MANIEYSRLLLKRSVTAGVVPTVPLSNNLNDFNATDIYEGELFYNVADGILFSRDLLGITVLGTPGAPANLLNTLLLGNNTGATDIVIDNPQVIRNPLASAPLDSYITTGVVGDPNRIVLESQDLAIGTDARLVVRSNALTAITAFVNDPAVTTSANLTVDAIPGLTQFFSKTDGTNTLDITHDLTGLGAAQTTNFLAATTTATTVVGLDIHSDFSGPGGTTKFTQNDTLISSAVNSAAHTMTLNAAGGGSLDIVVPRVNLLSAAGPVPYQAHDDDAAAGVAGLVTGDLYQTTGAGAAPLNAPGILMIKQ